MPHWSHCATAVDSLSGRRPPALAPRTARPIRAAAMAHTQSGRMTKIEVLLKPTGVVRERGDAHKDGAQTHKRRELCTSGKLCRGKSGVSVSLSRGATQTSHHWPSQADVCRGLAATPASNTYQGNGGGARSVKKSGQQKPPHRQNFELGAVALHQAVVGGAFDDGKWQRLHTA